MQRNRQDFPDSVLGFGKLQQRPTEKGLQMIGRVIDSALNIFAPQKLHQCVPLPVQYANNINMRSSVVVIDAQSSQARLIPKSSVIPAADFPSARDELVCLL